MPLLYFTQKSDFMNTAEHRMGTPFASRLVLLPKKIAKALHVIKLQLAGIYFTLFLKTYKKEGITLHVPFHLTDLKFRGRFPLNLYEVEETKHLKKYLSPHAKVLELGSCLGYTSCMINSILLNKNAHVALEANPNLIQWIKKNKQTNHCGFSLENAIVSHNKENTFYIHKLIVGGSTVRKTPKKVTVMGWTIDELKERYKLDFDTLIMDIEGGELNLFRDFKESISNFKTIFLEVHPFAGILTEQEAKECEDLLSELNFKLVVRDGHFQIWEK